MEMNHSVCFIQCEVVPWAEDEAKLGVFGGCVCLFGWKMGGHQ